MNGEAAISVVIAVRDGATLIAQALRSVQAQTLRPREVIVVDDHSRDDLDVVVADFPEVRLLRNPGEGVAEARNFGAANATQAWLAFLDADDLWPPERCARLWQHVQEDPKVELLCGAMQQFRDGNSGFEALGQPAASRLLTTSLLRRESFARVGGLCADLRIGDQIEWLSRAIDAGLRCAAIPDTVLLRRLHADNLGRTSPQPGRAYLDMLHQVLQRRRDSGTA